MELFIDDDGVAREYRDDYDITIHCESKEDQDKVWALLTRQWIPVTDRLPEKSGTYLITEKNFGLAEDSLVRQTIVHTAYFYNGAYDYEDGTHNDGTAGKWTGRIYNDIVSNITAWMPLPESWKGEKE